MRIETLRVMNFRGLRHAAAEGLSKSALVTVSGPNGAGKSLLVEAVTFLWRAWAPWPGQIDVRSLVGPWDEMASVEVGFALADEEQAALTVYSNEHGIGGTAPRVIHAGVRITKDGPFGNRHPEGVDPWIQALWSGDFAATHSFAHLDYLPADRGIQRGEQAQINPAVLSAEQTEGLRQQVFNSFVQQRQILTLTGVQPFLASLDYLDMLAIREGRESSGDFEAISGPFFEATGKTIHRPKIDPNAPFGASLKVETPAGAFHGLDQLSSGEQEVLALMFYVRRLSASGGLLLIDEPELHLHPALQHSLFTVMENVAARAQIWIVTHSSKLVTTAPLDAVLHMSPTDGTGVNQLTKASDEEGRGKLLSDLGVHPLDILQSDSLVILEGPFDAQRLPAALSLPLSRSAIYVAGGAQAVEATARSLMSGPPLIPWLAVRDRDLLSDDECVSLTSTIPNLFIWPHRTLENELLDPELVSRTLERAGVALSASAVRAALAELAERHRPDLIADLTELELKRRYPYKVASNRTALDQRLKYFAAQQESAASKIRDFEAVRNEVERMVEARWTEDWYTLMDGKRALAEFLQSTPFKTQADFVSAVTHTIREEPNFTPTGLASLRDRLEQMRLS